MKLEQYDGMNVVWVIQHYTNNCLYGIYTTLSNAKDAAEHVCKLLGGIDEWDEWDDEEVTDSEGCVYEVMYSNHAHAFHICRWALDRSYNAATTSPKLLRSVS